MVFASIHFCWCWYFAKKVILVNINGPTKQAKKTYDANLVAHTSKTLLVNKFKLGFRKWFKKGSSIVTSTSSQ